MTLPSDTPAKTPTARSIHRIVAILVGFFVLYLGVTGVLTQGVDIGAIVSHAPATDPNMKAIRESIDGTPNFAVIDTPDYAALPLPAGLDIKSALTRAMVSAQADTRPDRPLKFIEFRVVGGAPVVQALAGDHLLRFDAVTGQRLADMPVVKASGGPEQSLHRTMKSWHRLQGLSDWMLWLEILVGIGLGVLVVTGLIEYVRLLQARARVDRRALFWSSGGLLKSLHRAIALVSSIFLMVVTVSGTLLSIDSFVLQIYRATVPSEMIHGFPAGMSADYSTPLAASELPGMLDATLAAYQAAEGVRPIKVIRLRYFGGMAQGVIVTGGPATTQILFNTATGRRVSMTEPGYPRTGFPFGWEEHELMKRIHRGDVFGLTGRFMDLFAGLSLIYLSASGLWMYIDLKRRRGAVRTGPATTARQWMSVKVSARTEEATDIVSFELADAVGRSLPPFSAGAHIDVDVGDGLIRQYSLCNHPDEQHRYLIAVLKVSQSRGGSIAMHARFQEGSRLNISEPKNHFPLAPGARKSILFAGGIGITPILCMAERLASIGADFELHYSARSLDRMAFVDRIGTSTFVNKVHFHLDDGPADQKLDVISVLGQVSRDGAIPEDIHVYVCGPTGFMDWVLDTASRNQWPDAQLHREYFSPAPAPVDRPATAFEVQIASTGQTYLIPADLPITKALRVHGIDIPTSCEEGICGTCVTRVLDGVPDHRDLVLSVKQKARNDQMTPCCSRAKTAKLVLDL